MHLVKHTRISYRIFIQFNRVLNMFAVIIVPFLLISLYINLGINANEGFKRTFIFEEKWETVNEYENIDSRVICGALTATTENGHHFHLDAEMKSCKIGTIDEGAKEMTHYQEGLISMYKSGQLTKSTSPKVITTITTPTTCTMTSTRMTTTARSTTSYSTTISSGTTTVSTTSLSTSISSTKRTTTFTSTTATTHSITTTSATTSTSTTKTISFTNGYTKLMVVGGLPVSDDVEVVNLSEDGQTCEKPEKYPGAVHGSTGIFIDGHPTVCGGPSKSCHKYDVEIDKWIFWGELLNERNDAAGCLLGEDQWWISGGDPPENRRTSEIYSSTRTFETSYELPDHMLQHKMIRVNETSVIFLLDYCYLYIFNQHKPVDDMFVLLDEPTRRKASVAGIAQDSNGKKFLVLVGGDVFDDDHYNGENKLNIKSTTEIMDLETLEWNSVTTTSSLPLELMSAISVPFRNSFVVVGGFDVDAPSYHSTAIYEFDPDALEWITRSETLKTGRFKTAAFFVPDDAVKCG